MKKTKLETCTFQFHKDIVQVKEGEMQLLMSDIVEVYIKPPRFINLAIATWMLKSSFD